MNSRGTPIDEAMMSIMVDITQERLLASATSHREPLNRNIYSDPTKLPAPGGYTTIERETVAILTVLVTVRLEVPVYSAEEDHRDGVRVNVIVWETEVIFCVELSGIDEVIVSVMVMDASSVCDGVDCIVLVFVAASDADVVGDDVRSTDAVPKVLVGDTDVDGVRDDVAEGVAIRVGVSVGGGVTDPERVHVSVLVVLFDMDGEVEFVCVLGGVKVLVMVVLTVIVSVGDRDVECVGERVVDGEDEVVGVSDVVIVVLKVDVGVAVSVGDAVNCDGVRAEVFDGVADSDGVRLFVDVRLVVPDIAEEFVGVALDEGDPEFVAVGESVIFSDGVIVSFSEKVVDGLSVTFGVTEAVGVPLDDEGEGDRVGLRETVTDGSSDSVGDSDVVADGVSVEEGVADSVGVKLCVIEPLAVVVGENEVEGLHESDFDTEREDESVALFVGTCVFVADHD